jgi:hypothetical protein
VQTEPAAKGEPRGNAEHGNGQCELGVVPTHGETAVAERLQQTDLAALHRDQAHQHHVGEKRRDAEKDQR